MTVDGEQNIASRERHEPPLVKVDSYENGNEIEDVYLLSSPCSLGKEENSLLRHPLGAMVVGGGEKIASRDPQEPSLVGVKVNSAGSWVEIETEKGENDNCKSAVDSCPRTRALVEGYQIISLGETHHSSQATLH
jgi:hypothetical protein